MAGETEGPEQGALFRIEGPDDDGCVWAIFNDGEARNLGPRGPVAEACMTWLGQQDYGERPEDYREQPPGSDEGAARAS